MGRGGVQTPPTKTTLFRTCSTSFVRVCLVLEPCGRCALCTDLSTLQGIPSPADRLHTFLHLISKSEVGAVKTELCSPVHYQTPTVDPTLDPALGVNFTRTKSHTQSPTLHPTPQPILYLYARTPLVVRTAIRIELRPQSTTLDPLR